MVLAAGAGTRLRPLTDRLPKALIPVAGRPLLARVLERLVAVGVTRVIINTHHHAERIAAFVEQNTPNGVEIVLSPEPDGPYGTGGGLLAAARLFHRSGPFLLHNVDVLSQIPLDGVLRTHRASRERGQEQIVASVAVQARDARRQLLFDANGLLGWENRDDDGIVRASRHVRAPAGDLARWSFTGIHVLEPAIVDLADRTGTFSIIDWYLDLAQRGYAILPIDVSAYGWMDVGTPERLAEAEMVLSGGRVRE
jgi:NDP-sugar pyrophosphorylase family protein